MNKEIRKVKLISKNVSESLAYYSRFNLLYIPGVAKEICPAISEVFNKRLKKCAKTVHDLIGFEVYSRTDFIVDANDKIYFIETNSIPGMTPTSLLPKEAEVDGIDFSNLCRKVIELSIEKYQ